jgi:hypothetical protein
MCVCVLFTEIAQKITQNICVKLYKVCVEQYKVYAESFVFPCCLAWKDVSVSIITLPTDALAEWMCTRLANVRPWHRRFGAPLDHILFGKYISDQNHCIYVYWPSVLYSSGGRVVTVWSSSREIGSSSPPRPTYFLAKISVFLSYKLFITQAHPKFLQWQCGGSHKTIKSVGFQADNATNTNWAIKVGELEQKDQVSTKKHAQII